jgi:hypothetical protein
MATITSANMEFVLDEVVSSVMFESFFDEPFMYPMLFDVRTSNRRRERSASIGGLGEYQEKGRTQAAAEDQITEQFEKDFVHKSYAKQVAVERELIDDEEYGVLQEIGSQLGIMAAYSQEKTAAEIFNDGFAGVSHTGEDGKSLFNAAHVNSDGGNSQSNTGTETCGLSGIQTTRLAMRNFTNYRGEKLAIRPNMLIVPPDLEETAFEIVRSTGSTEDNKNAGVANFYNGRFDLAVWDFLTDTNAWFMADSRLMKQNLIWYQRTPLEQFGDGNLFTGTRRVGGYYRNSYGFKDWRWVFGNNPS